ncbi:TRAP transporter small permease subunit [Marispirochaeta sp.]|jgi:TRAP-type transport system small permease protein|uniref:TRAP transporter small permease n=1 Tax=Marispirochaeta sp. TaxID=2038653 RepID=UPI0029C95D45|nr:TRAP transporter small permease subunit [Marispirochaeta sp.]
MSLKLLEERLVVVMLAMLILLVFIAASLRWFGVSVAWSIDIAQLLFSWVCFIGADLALRTDSHVGVDMLVNRLPTKLRQGLILVLDILIFGFVLLIFYFGTKLCLQNYKRTFNTIPILSYSFVTLSAPVGAFLMGWTVVQRIRLHISRFLSR